MASMLLNEEFVAVFPSLVRRLGGMNKAAVLQAIHFASQIQSKRVGKNDWTPMTASQISIKTGLSEDAAQRALSALVEMRVLIGQPVKDGSRRLMWMIVHEMLETPREIAEQHPAKSRKDLREIAEYTTTKNNKKAPNNISALAEGNASNVAKGFVDKFKLIHSAEPDRVSVSRIARDAKRMLAEGRPLDVLIQSAELCAVRGHANLPSSLLALLAVGKSEPKGFAGIRSFLESDEQK